MDEWKFWWMSENFGGQVEIFVNEGNLVDEWKFWWTSGNSGE